ncbi:MAG: hypothetical protein Q9199_001938 [Rusavskia elegans]
MDNLSEEQLAMARMVLRPMPSSKPPRPILSTEQQLDQTISYLEKHNEEVRNQILSASLSSQQSRLSARTNGPPSATPSETKSIITSFHTTHNPSKPAPTYNNSTDCSPRYPPHPPTPSASDASPTAASIAREALERLKVFDDQASMTLAPFYMERERRRREKEPRRLEVPKEFGAQWVGMGGPGSGEDGKGAEAPEGMKGAGGMIDQSRDPRLRRG